MVLANFFEISQMLNPVLAKEKGTKNDQKIQKTQQKPIIFLDFRYF